MLIRNPYRLEMMEEDELAFIEGRYIRESKHFYLGMRWMLLIIVVLPLLLILLHQHVERKDGLSNAEVWFYAQCVTLLIYLFVFIFGYVRLLLPYVRDLKKKCKVVEQVLITEKKYMPQNNSYHFYINSLNRISIEVNDEHFNTLQVNDELCIEYAGYTEIYLGYF